MSEIPSTFLSKKTFQSLPQLAFWTWFIVFIIDAIGLQKFPYSFMRVAAVWVIGLAVSFIFEIVRYKNLNASDKAEYGSKFFFALNAFLIFMYAASYTGLTKQIGAWGVLQSTIDQQNNTINQSGILMAAQEWAIPIFAKQTSYFPDVTAIAENNRLKEENTRLNGLKNDTSKTDPLNADTEIVKDSLKNCIETNDVLTQEKDRYKTQVEVLLIRIGEFNRRQSKWRQVESTIFGPKTAAFKDQFNGYVMRVDPNDPDFYEFIFNTPINTELPVNEQGKAEKKQEYLNKK